MNKTTRKNILSALITSLILFAGFGLYQKLGSMKKSTVSSNIVKKERRKITVKSFDNQTVPNSIEIDGRLSAYDRVNITSKVQGIVQTPNRRVKEGQFFKKGELMYKIDDREASFNLKAQKAALLTAITQMMPDLKFDYPQSFEAWDTYLSSYDVNSTLKALPEPQSDSEKYFVAGRNIYSQYYNIKSLETRLSEYSIYAPFSGVLTSVNIDPGGMAMPGNTLATMINTSSYEYITTVPYESLSYIKPGQKVDLYVNEEGQNWTGTVSRIGTQIDPNTQNVPLYITVMGKALKDGMYLKGTLEGKSLEGIVTLPKTTLVDANHVFVVDDSTLVRKTVEPVKRTKDHVLIRGLTSDDQVVVSSLAGLFEGQKVNY